MNLDIPLLDLTQEDVDEAKSKVPKTKIIRKEQPLSRHEELRRKVSKMNPAFKAILRKEISQKQESSV